jgi:hypothetical protein
MPRRSSAKTVCPIIQTAIILEAIIQISKAVFLTLQLIMDIHDPGEPDLGVGSDFVRVDYPACRMTVSGHFCCHIYMILKLKNRNRWTGFSTHLRSVIALLPLNTAMLIG